MDNLIRTRHDLRDWRMARNMTQRDLAACLGVQYTIVSRWERGTVEPNWRILGLALDALDRTEQE